VEGASVSNVVINGGCSERSTGEKVPCESWEWGRGGKVDKNGSMKNGLLASVPYGYIYI